MKSEIDLRNMMGKNCIDCKNCEELTSTVDSSSSHVPLTLPGVSMIGPTASSPAGTSSSAVIKSSSSKIATLPGSVVSSGAPLPLLDDLEPFKVLPDTSAACLSNRSKIDCFKYFII